MLVEVVSNKDSLVIDVSDDVSNVLPFKTELIRWKEEVYFRTPYDADLSKLSSYVRAEVGRVYYWPPGKAFCLFYGISEPYTEVYLIGNYVGLLSTLRRLDVGEVNVVKHELSKDLEPIIESLIRLGYSVATPLEDGIRVVTACKYLGGVRIAFKILREEYGLHIESDTLFRFSDDFVGLKAVYGLKRRVHQLSNLVRLDLNEDNYICLTGALRDVSGLETLVDELEDAYQYVFKELVI